MIELFCPACRQKLSQEIGSYCCKDCGFRLVLDDGLLVNPSVGLLKETDFYDQIYERDKGAAWLTGLKRAGLAKKLLEMFSLSYRRERFFSRNIMGRNNLILDLGCGAGREMLKSRGQVVGVDLSKKPLKLAAKLYDMAILSDIKSLPFADNSFDYVISADLFGHIESNDKDLIYREINRVLKSGGKSLNIIETDSENCWFRFAHRWPELFEKYFILGIGGHFGLELPTQAVERWQRAGFEIVKAQKIWGTVWPIQDYLIFDNEYQTKSDRIGLIVTISKALSANRVVKILVNIILNPLNSLVESFYGLNHGQGLMLICRKK